MIYWFQYTYDQYTNDLLVSVHSSFLLLSFAGMDIQTFEKKESKFGHFLLDLQKLVKRTSRYFYSCNTLCPNELFNLTFISFFFFNDSLYLVDTEWRETCFIGWIIFAYIWPFGKICSLKHLNFIPYVLYT